jgi:dolichyl-phosphate-mannose--protein O-mannosyl transferase
MTKDTFQLLKYATIAVLLIAIWFGLLTLSRNIGVDLLLGFVGFAVFALYWRWLKKTKIAPPKP